MAVTTAAPKPSTVRHEDFCPVVAAGSEPRIESFPYVGDDPATGRSRITHDVTRCLDCGAANYTARS